MENVVTQVLIRTLIICQLRYESSRARTIADCLGLASNFDDRITIPPMLKRRNFSIRPLQIKEEVARLLGIVARLSPQRILEIGTANGGMLFLLAMVSSPDATVISIDLPGGSFGGSYPVWKIPLYESFARYRQRIYLVRQDSHRLATLSRTEEILNGNKLDFLFIDGDHKYVGVKRDFEMYAPLVRKGGIIAFHDIVPGFPERVGAVPLFWHEIRDKNSYIEIVKDWNQGGFGIGVIQV